MTTPRRAVGSITEATLVAALVGAAHLALGPNPLEALGVLYDDTVYLSLGQAIASGEGYRSIHIVGAPVHAKFPPGLPLLYALGWLACGGLSCTVRIAALLSVAATAATAGLLWWYARQVLGTGRATTLALVAAPFVLRDAVRYLNGGVSEPLFMLAWASTLVLCDRIARSESPARRTAIAVGLGLTLAAAALVRSQGLVLIPAVIGALLLSRATWRAAVTAGVSAAGPLIVWKVWHGQMLARGPIANLPDQVPYTEWLPRGSSAEIARFVTEVVRHNAKDYAGISSFMLVGETSTVGLVLAVGLGLMVVSGALMLLKRAPAIPLTIAINILVIVFWPFSQSRFLVPIFPFAGLAAAYAIERALNARPARLRLAALGALLLLVLTLELGRPKVPAGRYSAFSPTFVERGLEVASWITRNTPPNARILIDRGSLFFLRTGRPTSVAWPEESEVGTTSVFEAPGRFHAERLLADSADFIVAWGAMGRQTQAHLLHIESRCPGLLVKLPPLPRRGVRMPTAFYRVEKSRFACVEAAAGVFPPVSVSLTAPTAPTLRPPAPAPSPSTPSASAARP